MKVITNQKGFTLIELLIVIGIIGILSVIAIPNFMRFQAKAKQTEAKLALSGLYTAEKAFFAEYSSYSDGMVSIGYAPDGAKRYYNVGFLATCVTGTVAAYTPTGAPSNTGTPPTLPSGTWMPATGSGPTAVSSAGITAVPVGAVTTIVNPLGTTNTFTAGACGYLRSDTFYTTTDPNDFWTIDQNRSLLSVVNGT